MTRLLYLEDNPGDVRLLLAKLAEAAPGEFVVTHVERLKDALLRAAGEAFDVMLSDLTLPDSDCLATVKTIATRFPALPLVVLTGSNDYALGNESIQLGAEDYLVKQDASGSILARTLRFAIQRKSLELDLLEAKASLERRVAERTANLEATLAELQQTLSSTQAVAETAADAIITTNQSGNILSWNRAAERIFGYSKAEALGQPLTLLMPLRYRSRHTEGLKRAQQGGYQPMSGRAVELIGLNKTGHEFPIELSLSMSWSSADGKMFTGIIRDISRRKRAEQVLQAALADKEALLKEVHHRVKNNLQVITSLLRLEVGRSAQPDTRSVLGEMQGRIRSMALLHENLYRSGTFAAVDLGTYLKQLATQIFRAHSVHSEGVRLQLELTSVQVGMDHATPCGLLVNELISNSLKHGFPHGRGGEIRVTLALQADGTRLRLGVSDNGVGLPADFETRRGQSLGLQLGADLARQLGSTLQVEDGPGAAFSVSFDGDESKTFMAGASDE